MNAHDRFVALHQPGTPLLLYNIWDAGSAQAVARAGARAIATGSMSVAGAHGYEDGEALPLEDLLATVREIVRAVDLPVTVDFEGGYARDPQALAQNARLLAETGALGCNFEDRIVAGDGLYPLDEQADRIAAVASSGLFVNARTDLFLARLMAGENPDDPALVELAIERGARFAQAGAKGFFVPGLADADLIGEICREVTLPVNVMMREGVPPVAELAGLGVARVSWGPGPWRDAQARLEQVARAALATG
jgi:2-methylisocitrate lyase-like PEP mutase family enzyme|tara:strand:+ start:2308 stop:3060 length:753 start_codon:yes stop_codon:yes gene_type:complete